VSAQPAELLQGSIPDSALGRIGVREVPMRVPVLAPDGALVPGWIGEGKGIPAGRIGAAGSMLEPKKLGVILPVTVESVRAAGGRIERIFERDVRAAISRALDLAFLDPLNDGTGDRPAAITNGAPSVASSGDPVADLLALAAGFPGRLERASLITDPLTALELSLWADSSGAARFFDAGPRGGSLATMPLIVSGACPRDSSGGLLVLVDGGGIAAAVDTIEFTASREVLIEQDTAPTADALAPTAASATLVSAFQAELVALKAVITCSWRRVLPYVSVCTGAQYS
jgi:HK97 family phage major capsid protein